MLTRGSSMVMRGASMASSMSTVSFAPMGAGPNDGKDTCATATQPLIRRLRPESADGLGGSSHAND